MHELTSILDFLNGLPSPKAGIFCLLMAYCYVATLILILIIADYELVYNGTRGGFGHLEPVLPLNFFLDKITEMSVQKVCQ